MKGTFEKPYVSLYGAMPRGTLFEVTFQYTGEEPRTQEKRGAGELKEFIAFVKEHGAAIVNVTSYYKNTETDVTAKYNK